MLSKNKKFFALLLVALFAISQFVLASAYTDVADTSWYAPAVNRWGSLLTSNDEIMPAQNATRAEFAHVLNGVMKFPLVDSTFSDVPSTHPYAADIGALQAAGIVLGREDGFDPDTAITRAEISVMYARAFALTPSGAPTFADADTIPDYAAPYVNALQVGKYVNGYEDNTFRPSRNITRAEMFQIIDNAARNFVENSDEVTEVITGNMMIIAPEAYIKNISVIGDVIIAPGVGASNVTFESVIVTGTVYIRGGSASSVKFLGACSIGRVVADSAIEDELMIDIDPDSTVSALVVTGGTKLLLDGAVGVLTVDASTDVEIVSGTVGSLNVNAAETSIIIDKDAEVENIYSSANAVGVVFTISGKVSGETIVASPAAEIDVAADALVEDLNVTGSAAGAIVNNQGTISKLVVKSVTAEINNTGTIASSAAPEGTTVTGTQPESSETTDAGSPNDVY